MSNDEVVYDPLLNPLFVKQTAGIHISTVREQTPPRPRTPTTPTTNTPFSPNKSIQEKKNMFQALLSDDSGPLNTQSSSATSNPLFSDSKIHASKRSGSTFFADDDEDENLKAIGLPPSTNSKPRAKITVSTNRNSMVVPTTAGHVDVTGNQPLDILAGHGGKQSAGSDDDEGESTYAKFKQQQQKQKEEEEARKQIERAKIAALVMSQEEAVGDERQQSEKSQLFADDDEGSGKPEKAKLDKPIKQESKKQVDLFGSDEPVLKPTKKITVATKSLFDDTNVDFENMPDQKQSQPQNETTTTSTSDTSASNLPKKAKHTINFEDEINEIETPTPNSFSDPLFTESKPEISTKNSILSFVEDNSTAEIQQPTMVKATKKDLFDDDDLFAKHESKNKNLVTEPKKGKKKPELPVKQSEKASLLFGEGVANTSSNQRAQIDDNSEDLFLTKKTQPKANVLFEDQVDDNQISKLVTKIDNSLLDVDDDDINFLEKAITSPNSNKESVGVSTTPVTTQKPERAKLDPDLFDLGTNTKNTLESFSFIKSYISNQESTSQKKGLFDD